MNERIKELANKAGYNDLIYEISKEGLDKLVKLTVQECCNTIERRYKYSNGTPMSFWEMSQDIQDLLKAHFGVEE